MTAHLDRVAFLVVESGLARAPKHSTDSTGTDYLLRQVEDGPLDIWDELKPIKHALADSRPGAKAVGYLMAVSATGDEPARWETHERVVSTTADSPAAADLREAAWLAGAEGEPLVGWTDEFVTTIERALDRATQRGSASAGIRDLALALVTGPRNRAVEALEKGGADAAAAAAALQALPDSAEGIRTPSLDALEYTGALAGPAKKRGLFARLSGGSETAALGSVVATEAVRQAVRAGAADVGSEHVLAAVASVRAQVVQAGREWTDEVGADVDIFAVTPATALIPSAWPTIEQELPQRITPLATFSEVLAALA